MPSVQGASHVALTVRDMAASADWYQRVFGWQILRRYGKDEAGSPRILLLDRASGFVVALCQPDDGAAGTFDHRAQDSTTSRSGWPTKQNWIGG